MLGEFVEGEKNPTRLHRNKCDVFYLFIYLTLKICQVCGAWCLIIIHREFENQRENNALRKKCWFRETEAAVGLEAWSLPMQWVDGVTDQNIIGRLVGCGAQRERQATSLHLCMLCPPPWFLQQLMRVLGGSPTD